MKNINTIDVIVRSVIDSIKTINKQHFVILIGGCSRTGKSTLSKQLLNEFKKLGLNTLLISIDSWLLSIEDRKPNSHVYDRYDTEGIARALNDLINGKTIVPPVYDLVTRRRHKNIKGSSLNLESGILIIEGTITLTIKRLLQKSDLNIFVSTSDYTRIKRLLDFYSRVKGLNSTEYKNILRSRENEEIPFIKQSAKNAHFIFQKST